MRLPKLPDGQVWHHVAVCPADWPGGLATLMKLAPKAKRTVAWDYDVRGQRLVPYEVEDGPD